MKRLTVSLGLLLTLGLLGTPAQAQTGTARGKVLDEEAKPVAGAKVLIEYQGGGTQKYDTESNKKGEFIQVGIYPFPYKITATRDGYQGYYVDIRISLGDPTIIPDFKLVSAKAVAAATGPSQGEIRSQFEKASKLTQAGQLDEAEALYKEILAKAPSVPEVHYNLGYIYSQRKDWTNAEAEFQKALELRPDYSDAVIALARAYQDSGNEAKAQETIEKAVAAAPNDGKLLFNLAIFHVNSGQQQEAMEDLLKAEAADPSNQLGGAFRPQAVSQDRASNGERAARRLERVLDEHLTLASFEPVNETNSDIPFYTMRYTGDYGFQEYLHSRSLAQGSAHRPARTAALEWGCTTFTGRTPQGEALIARIFDWYRHPALLLFTNPQDGYASASMVDISYLGFDGPIQAGESLEPLLRAPYLPFDGFNEMGLGVGMMAVRHGEGGNDPGKAALDSLEIIRLVLDKAAIVDEALRTPRGRQTR